jgi:predicted nucleic acid-binding protein
MVLVDSCVWIEASRKQGDPLAKLAVQHLLDEAEAAFCGPIRLEVLGGARKQFRKPLGFFFEAIPYLPMPESLWQEAQLLSWRMRDAGFTLPWNDLLIATGARKAGCRVYSLDSHFHALADQREVRLYQPGYGGAYSPES